MSLYRNMRIILMFDLPTVEDIEKKEYTLFRKNLIKNGYIMMQYSVYVKCVPNQSNVKMEVNRLKKIMPPDGNVRILYITEKQYQDMEIVLGNKKSNEIYNNDKRYIKI